MTRADADSTVSSFTSDPDCAFCKIVTGGAPAAVVCQWPDAIAFRPQNPVEPGHVLVMPRHHVADFTTNPDVTAAVARRAAELGSGLLKSGAAPAANLITSAGSEATQTVFHLHLHIVLRNSGDGLPLPWTPQQETDAASARST